MLVDECCEVTGIAGGCDLASLLGEALLFGHRGSEAVFVDLDTAFAGDLLGDLEWETVGVVQQEGDVAGECRTVGKGVELFVEDRLPLRRVSRKRTSSRSMTSRTNWWLAARSG